jgi:hypothetical protein
MRFHRCGSNSQPDAVEARSGRLMCGPRAAVSAEHSGMARVTPGTDAPESGAKVGQRNISLCKLMA